MEEFKNIKYYGLLVSVEYVSWYPLDFSCYVNPLGVM